LDITYKHPDSYFWVQTAGENIPYDRGMNTENATQPNRPERIPLFVRLPEPTYSKLKMLAEREDRTLGKQIERIIRDALREECPNGDTS